MTCNPKPPMMTHQPGLPADSASRAKAGGSPEDQPTSPIWKRITNDARLEKGDLLLVPRMGHNDFKAKRIGVFLSEHADGMLVILLDGKIINKQKTYCLQQTKHACTKRIES